MGNLNAISEELRNNKNSFNYEKVKKEKFEIPVKLVEPSFGRVVELEVTEKDENKAKAYMNQLKKYAKFMQKFGAHYSIIAKKIQITFLSVDMAENTRQKWKL